MQWVVTLVVLCSKQKSDWMIDVYLFEHQTSRVFGRHVCLNQTKGAVEYDPYFWRWEPKWIFNLIFEQWNKNQSLFCMKFFGTANTRIFAKLRKFFRKNRNSSIPKPGWRNFILDNFHVCLQGEICCTLTADMLRNCFWWGVKRKMSSYARCERIFVTWEEEEPPVQYLYFSIRSFGRDGLLAIVVGNLGRRVLFDKYDCNQIRQHLGHDYNVHNLE